MRCDEFDERVHRLLDDRMPIHGDQRLLEHAEACSKCRGLLGTYDDLFGGLESGQIPEVSPGFTQRVVAQVCTGQPQTEPSPKRARRWYALAAVAIAAALLIAIFPLLRSRLAPNQPNVPKLVEDNHKEQGEPPAPKSTNGETLHDDAPQVALEPGDVHPDAEAEAKQLRDLVDQLAPSLPYTRIVPVDQIRGGFRPIASSLAVAIDALRNTIPIGRTDHSKEPSGHSPSAQFAPSEHISV